MTWVADEELEEWQEAVSRGEALCLDECRHLLAEVRRLRCQAAERQALASALKQQVEQAWEQERIALRERDVARDEADRINERLRWYEEKLESLTC